jgi:type II secretory pathway pseudopilin PulG
MPTLTVALAIFATLGTAATTAWATASGKTVTKKKGR